MDDEQLGLLAKDIDDKLIEWLTTYKTSPLNLSGVMLARLCWLVKLSNSEEDFIRLLDSPRDILIKELDGKQLH